MTKRTISKALKNEGFQVKGRRTSKSDGSELQTTCVFSILLTQPYLSLVKSQVKLHVKNDLKKHSSSVSFGKQIKDENEKLDVKEEKVK